MGQGLYLGRQQDPSSGALGDKLELDPADLLTHGLIVGMTGSGKTGLGIVLIEEALRQGIPVLAIDPKGDLGNLLLLFDALDGPSFGSWVDLEAAGRDGKTAETAGVEAAEAWRKGLGEWGLSSADVAALRRSRDAVIYTPGSTAGVPLNVLQSLAAPEVPFDSAEEDLRDEIAGIVSGMLGLLHIDADPLKSREHILLSALIESAWRSKQDLTLEALIGRVADPSLDRLGALPLESMYPRKERQQLVLALNNLLASPSFAAWREGEPLEIDRLLRAADGRPRLSVIYTAHLSDEERLFVTALLLDKVKTWMRGQPGTAELRALIYMDEIFGYFPPHPANPPPKRPLLTLLKQARSQGVGLVLATQNPVDLDYKGLANIGTWMIGTLQTEQDRARLRQGLTGSATSPPQVDQLLAATAKRVFLFHDVHRPAPCLLHTRWTLSYLRGPLTRTEISRLKAERSAQAPAPAPSQARPAAADSEAPPLLPPPFRHHYFRRYGGELADPYVFVKYAVRYKGADEMVGARAYSLAVSAAAEICEAEPLAIDEAALASITPPGIRYAALPELLATAGAKGIERALRERLPDKLAATLWADPVTKASSAPGEAKEAFAARLQAAGGSVGAERLRDQLERKRRDLAAREQELAGRRTEKWAALGSAILSNIGLFTGRKRTISGAGSVLSKNRMENSAEARVEALRTEIGSMEEELGRLTAVDPERLVAQQLVPARSDVKILRYDLVWVY